MKELNIQKKKKVVRLFFAGWSYDGISLKTGIAKGSVYNIIEEFREGLIPLPYDTEEYLDTLRKLVTCPHKVYHLLS